MPIQSLARPSRGLAAALLALCCAAAQAQSPAVPHSTAASPDVYKVVAENARYRVIQVTWAPGQKDADHSHPESAGYFLDSCQLRFFLPNGTTSDLARPAGFAVVQGPISSHAVQNIGTAPCRLVMFEPK